MRKITKIEIITRASKLEELKEELQQLYPNSNIICDPLSLSVSCHIGPHALAIRSY